MRPVVEKAASSSPQSEVQALQDTAGNQAVGQLLGNGDQQAEEVDSLPDHVQGVLSSPGQSLDPAPRKVLENQFGRKFDSVRVHTDGIAQESAQAMEAKAYTVGEDIAFGQDRYNPEPGPGLALLAHELAHVVQQRQATRVGGGHLSERGDGFERAADRMSVTALAGQALQPAPAGSPPAIQRQGLEEELDQELETFAKQFDPSFDPSRQENISLLLSQYAQKLALVGDEGIVRPEPEGKEEKEAWKKDFKKVQILAKRLLEMGDEFMAVTVTNYLAQAGFIDEAMELAAGFKDETGRKRIYLHAVERPDAASTEQLKLLTEFFAVTERKNLSEHPLLTVLKKDKFAVCKKLDNEKLQTILEVLVERYPHDKDLIDFLALLLFYHRAFRPVFSSWLMTKDPDLLFSVVEHPYFADPDYGEAQLPTGESDESALTMEEDMPWVYSVKQEYYVNYLTNLVQRHGGEIEKPAGSGTEQLRDWLEQYTETIGQALAKEYPEDPESITAVYEKIADIFFFHVDLGNVVPNLAGHIGHLQPGAPANKRFKADCDVLATYATRLLASSGLTPVGYMAVVPTGKNINLDRHVVALLKKGDVYYVVSNIEISKFTLPETGDETVPLEEGVEKKEPTEKEIEEAKARNKMAAITKLRDAALDIYSGESLEEYKVYYADAREDGAMSRTIYDLDETARVKDLEPKSEDDRSIEE